ncbi:hypothetical protein CUR178_08413 [Leishmania enriettii]|uniref:Uncharacterized protein n=1 Tax=Leishmania enriettii TaxID=5663 RepID=A0A836I277_LEIEN|nr:hypothetical protein CUR178_08413 [Leishmania enriettii]
MRQFTYRTALTAAASLAAHATVTTRRGCYASSHVGISGAPAAEPSQSSSARYRHTSVPPRHARPVGARGPVKDRFPPVPTDLADPRRRLAVLVDGSNPNLIPGGCSTVDEVYRTSALFTTVLPAVLQVGVPVLLRVFAHHLPAAWEPLLAGSSAAHGGTACAGHNAPTDGAGRPISLIPLPLPSSPPSAAPPTTAAGDALAVPQVQFEYFRVERFIPVAMQIEADARHIYELRHTNKVEAVCYICHEVDRAMFISLMEEQRMGSVKLEELLHEVTGKGGKTGANGERAAEAAFFNQYVLDEFGMAGELLTDSRSKNGA